MCGRWAAWLSVVGDELPPPDVLHEVHATLVLPRLKYVKLTHEFHTAWGGVGIGA